VEIAARAVCALCGLVLLELTTLKVIRKRANVAVDTLMAMAALSLFWVAVR